MQSIIPDMISPFICPGWLCVLSQVIINALALASPGEGARQLAAATAMKSHSLRKWPLSLSMLIASRAPGSDGEEKQDARRREGGEGQVGSAHGRCRCQVAVGPHQVALGCGLACCSIPPPLGSGGEGRDRR